MNATVELYSETYTAVPWLEKRFNNASESDDSTTSLWTTESTLHWLHANQTNINDTAYTTREDSEAEMVLNIVFTALFVLIALIGNIVLLVVMWKFNVLKQCNRLIHTLTAVVDMIMVISTANLLISISVFRQLSPSLFCRINSQVLVVCMAVQMNMSALLAIERYTFIVKPTKYRIWVTTTRVILSFIAILSLPLLSAIIFWSVSTYVECRSATFLCVADTANAVVFILIMLPGIVIVCILLIKLGLFINKKASNSSEALDEKKAIKLLLLISGNLFCTYIPGYVIRMLIAQVWSWEELDAGVNVPAFITVRCTTFIIGFVSSACNPLVQFYVEKDLRAGLRKIMGQKAYFAFQKDMIAAVNVRKHNSVGPMLNS